MTPTHLKNCIFIISLSKVNLPLIGSFYVTHAARALQSHDLSGEGIKLWITDILFWPHKDMEGLPGWVNSPMPGPPPRQHKHERQYTPSIHPFIPTRRMWNDDYGGQMIFGDLVGLKFPDICLTGEEKPRKKPHPGNHIIYCILYIYVYIACGCVWWTRYCSVCLLA